MKVGGCSWIRRATGDQFHSFKTGKFCQGTGAQRNQRFDWRRCQLQIDRDGLTFGQTPQTIRRPACGLGTVTERNRKCLLQRDAVNLVIVDRPAALAGKRRTRGKHRSSERPPFSARSGTSADRTLWPPARINFPFAPNSPGVVQRERRFWRTSQSMTTGCYLCVHRAMELSSCAHLPA
jgi:hypothetical protein